MHLPRELQLMTRIDVPYLRDETLWLLYISSHDLLQLLFKGGHYSILYTCYLNWVMRHKLVSHQS